MNDGVKILLVFGLVGGAGFLAYKLLSKKGTKSTNQKTLPKKATPTEKAQNDISKIAAPDKIELYTTDGNFHFKHSLTVPIGNLYNVKYTSKYGIIIYQNKAYLSDKDVKNLYTSPNKSPIPVKDEMFSQMRSIVTSSYDLVFNEIDSSLYFVKSSDKKYIVNSISFA